MRSAGHKYKSKAALFHPRAQSVTGDKQSKTQLSDAKGATPGKLEQAEEKVESGRTTKPAEDLNLLTISGITVTKEDAVKAAAVGTAAVLGAAVLVATRGKSGLTQGARMAEANLGTSAVEGLAAATKAGALPLGKEVALQGRAGLTQMGALEAKQALKLEAGKTGGTYAKISDEAARAEIAQIKATFAPERTAGKILRDKAAAAMQEQEAKGFVPRHPVSGELLSKPEHFKVAYMDTLPVKSAPEFIPTGRLMPGKYPMDWQTFSSHFGQGSERQKLLSEFQSTLQKLKEMGVKEVNVGGSFVSKKPVPGDIDFIFDRGAPGVNQKLLQSAHDGIFSVSSAPALREKGMQMMVGPTDNATFKSLQYFMSHHNESLSGTIRSEIRPKRLAIPNGLVVLRL